MCIFVLARRWSGRPLTWAVLLGLTSAVVGLSGCDDSENTNSSSTGVDLPTATAAGQPGSSTAGDAQAPTPGNGGDTSAGNRPNTPNAPATSTATGGQPGSATQAPTGTDTGGEASSNPSPSDNTAASLAHDAGMPGTTSTTSDDGTTTGGAPGDASDEPQQSDLCDVGVDDGTTPEVLALSGNTFAHDPTMIEADGVFYRFWTAPDIPMASSRDLRHWQDGPPVYTAGTPDWFDDWIRTVPGQTFNFPWAPDVSYFGGRYHLYSSFSGRFGANYSCITHLTTTDIASGDWEDHGPVICSKAGDGHNAIDADVGFEEDGTPWLSFGSWWDGIKAFKLTASGERADDELIHLAQTASPNDGIEAPVLFRRCGYYYLFVSWGLCCPGQGRSVNQLTYRVAVGRSRDIQGPYVDRNGKPMLEGGGTLMVQGNFEFAAAGHSDVLVHEDKVYHFYHAYRRRDGGAELRIVEMPFDKDGWPIPAGP